VLYHHERYDGLGYPYGLKGQEIPLGARIVTLADAFSAMLQKRAYKESMSLDRAVEEVLAHSATQFCPYVVSIFARLLNQDFESVGGRLFKRLKAALV
jgi:HD-GYP domain-containing protein (c-di-GMP phosphodiesterase class II)